MRNTTRWRALAFAAGALVLSVGTAGAQDAQAPILNHTFEQNDGGWMGVGASSAVSVTHDTAVVKNGKSALQFAYALKKGELNLLLLSTPDMVLSKVKSLKFWVRTDHATPLAFVLQEKDGGRYTAAFSVPKNTWQQVELSTSDFVLDRGKDAPADADSKLDMDQVENAGVFDIAQLFVQGDEALAKAFGIDAGARNLYMDDFTASPVASMPAATLKNGEGLVDTGAHPQVDWVGLGEVQLSRANGKPLEGAGVQAKYHQGPGRIAGFLRYIHMGAFTGASSLALSAASLKPAKLIVQVEEKSGGKYNTVLELPGNSGRADLTVKFADFKAADDSHDDNNKLDLDQVVQIVIFDASGIIDQADADNTLWINNVKAAR